MCSRTGVPHELLSGTVDDNGKKGRFKTSIACPYPWDFCAHVSAALVQPDHRETVSVSCMKLKSRDGTAAAS